MNCPNCGNPDYVKGETCFQCGVGDRVGPPYPETSDNIRRPTLEELAQKRRKAHGRLLSETEAAEIRKRLGKE